MAQRTTRNKILFQAKSALEDLQRAQTHFVQLSVLADNQSKHIAEDLPMIVAALDMVIDAFTKFKEEL